MIVCSCAAITDGDIERAIAEPGNVTSDRGETEVPRERPRFDVDRGQDEEAPHAPGGDAALAASLLRSQAAYELPAAVSLPENRIARMRA